MRYPKKGEPLTAGCDEAGRGCLAGPVFAAAVVWPVEKELPGLNDSKQLSAKQREALRVHIEENALAWAVASSDAQEIDRVNILQASILAMHRAVEMLSLKPEFLLIDGNRFKPYFGIPHRCEVKGDGKFACIAAASVLAKTHRDAYMQGLSKSYPAYGWEKNKGYPTKLHRKAIALHGLTKEHRLSFKR